MNMKKNRKGERYTLADEVADMVGMETEDVVAMLHGMHLSSIKMLDILSLHCARTTCGYTCRSCENAHLCSSRPMLRMMLANYMEKDMSCLKGRDDYRS